MRNKLAAIWKILKSEYYVLVTMNGSLYSCLPRDLNTLNIMQEMVDKVKVKEPK